MPRPRSGVQMFLHASEDSIYVWGGFSKEKFATTTSSKREGRVHDDMWILRLKPMMLSISEKHGGSAVSGSGGGSSKHSGGSSSSSSSSSTQQQLDITRAVWERVSRKGDFPSSRCGCASVLYKNKLLVFGGVFDDEG